MDLQNFYSVKNTRFFTSIRNQIIAHKYKNKNEKSYTNNETLSSTSRKLLKNYNFSFKTH